MERERAKDENLAGPQGRDSRPDLALVNCQQKKKEAMNIGAGGALFMFVPMSFIMVK